jgi:hypothetical protein
MSGFYGKPTGYAGAVVVTGSDQAVGGEFYGTWEPEPDWDEELRRHLNEADEFTFESAFENESSVEPEGNHHQRSPEK